MTKASLLVRLPRSSNLLMGFSRNISLIGKLGVSPASIILNLNSESGK